MAQGLTEESPHIHQCGCDGFKGPGVILDGETEAEFLLEKLFDGYDERYGLGNMSCATYDTALAALVGRPTQSGGREWLFPESLQYLLVTQESSGGWQTGVSHIDGILNTMAALLALTRHSKIAGDKPYADEISKAQGYLKSQLNAWNLDTTRHVGFEVLVPLYLDLLEEDGLAFIFPARNALLALRDKKMAKLDVNLLYGGGDLSIVHSLESLTGILDFNRVSHRKAFGSMMGSPSATAAYVMHSIAWDQESENYLRQVFTCGAGRGKGGMPSAYPSTIFEITWMVTTLLGLGGVSKNLKQLSLAKKILKGAYDAGNGVVGFAPWMGADADDSAQCISSLHLLGDSVPAAGLVKLFETPSHFKTYNLERDPSFSANCNVLTALFQSLEGPSRFKPQIEKVARFICNTWWDMSCEIMDKWNLSSLYPVLVMAKSFSCLITAQHRGHVELHSELIQDVLLVAFQALTRVLGFQSPDGSWFQSEEQTAYAVIALSNLTLHPSADAMRTIIDQSISQGRAYLRKDFRLDWAPEYLWIEKVTYGIPLLSKAYVLAAHTCIPWEHQVNLLDFSLELQAGSIFTRLPYLSQHPGWKVKAWLIENMLLQPRLRAALPGIFPRDGMREETYLKFIPFTWLVGGSKLDNQISLDMMALSALIYQFDEYIEGVVGSLSAVDINRIRRNLGEYFKQYISEMVQAHQANGDARSEGIKHDRLCGVLHESSSPEITEMQKVLLHFFEYVLAHPRLSGATFVDLRALASTLECYILASLRQAEDSRNGAPHAGKSFYSWVNSTGADTTGGPFAFWFLMGLEGARRKDKGKSLNQAYNRYLAEDVSRLVSVMCRMYNDFASIRRDREESNINSLDFNEFRVAVGDENLLEEQKNAILYLARFERKKLELAMSELENLLGQRACAVRSFVDVTDIYGQLYILRDMSPTVKKHTTKEPL